jgi:FkbM family methyltransferase
MLKSFAKSALATAFNCLPLSVRRAAIERAGTGPDPYAIFQALGRSFAVKEIGIAGRYGLIEGSIEDGSVLARYGQTGVWAPQINKLFIDFFDGRGGGTYLDIGANIGLTTIPIARNGRVSCFAIEPEPTNYGYLECNVRKNCMHSNVQLLNLALFDRQTTIDFELSKQNGGDHRVRVTASAGSFDEQRREVIKVATQTLDSLLDPVAMRLPLAAKIDTQGAECQVVGGGKTVLSRAELLAFEFWPYGIRRMEGDHHLLVDFVSEYFRQGAIVNGERDEIPAWHPIEAVADELRALWRADHTAYRYHDVFVRK